jgi:Tfp pilus assembly protein PilF
MARPSAGVLAALLLVASIGCRRSAAPAGPPPTFNADVAPILFQKCAGCHRPGQAAVPFPLLSFDDAKLRAEKIGKAVGERHMPPWLPERGEPRFVGERGLSDAQIQTIQRWVAAGAPQGSGPAPQPPAFTAGWQTGTPDLILATDRPYVMEPAHEDVFRNVVLKTTVTRTRYVRTVEFDPGSAPIHHAIIRLDRTSDSRTRDGADGQPGFSGMAGLDAQNPDGHFIGWAPGRGPIMAPEGMPWTLEPGVDLVVELHLLHGRARTEVQPKVGLYFTDSPPTRTPVMAVMGSKAIDIPAGATDYPIEDSYTLPVDATVLSVYPHAHYLGKDIRVTATLPDGRSQTLIHIPQWDFHWQQDYRYVTPIELPRGTRVTMRFTYDNSDANEDNPHHPPVPVRFGGQSSDEMGNVGVQFLPKSAADAAVIVKDFQIKDALSNVASAEMYIRHEPNSAFRRMQLGSSYLEVGRVADAVTNLEMAVRLDPTLTQAHNFLGGALVSAGRIPEALSHLREATRLAPTDAHLHYNLAKALEMAGELPDARRAYERAITLNPRFADPHQSLGALLFSQDQLTAALGHFRRAVELAPASAMAHSDYGAALAQAGRRAEAIAEMQRALELDPTDGAARENLGRLLGR